MNVDTQKHYRTIVDPTQLLLNYVQPRGQIIFDIKSLLHVFENVSKNKLYNICPIPLYFLRDQK